MNSSPLRTRNPSLLARTVLAVTLSAMGAAAYGSESATEVETANLSADVTSRVTESLADRIDAAVASEASHEFPVRPSITAAHAARADARATATARDAEPAPATPSARAAVEHTRVYIAIKDGARSGALVQ